MSVIVLSFEQKKFFSPIYALFPFILLNQNAFETSEEGFLLLVIDIHTFLDHFSCFMSNPS